jgi:hypothetical protein
MPEPTSPSRTPEPLLTRAQDRDEWNGKGSVATTQAARDTVAALVMVPTNDGGMMLDWHAGGLEVEIEVRPDGSLDGISVYRHTPTKPVQNGEDRPSGAPPESVRGAG